MPAVYDKLGICFSYPENWELDESDALLGEPSVSVVSPTGGFWSVSRYEPDTNAEALAQAALKAMQNEYPETEVEEVQEVIAEQSLAGMNLNFFYLDFVTTAVIRSFSNSQGTFLFLYQAEDREFEKIKRVFEAITVSLINKPNT